MQYDYSWLDRPTLIRLKAEYEKAKQAGLEQFVFEVRGQELPMLVKFAKYLIEWRENTLESEAR